MRRLATEDDRLFAGDSQEPDQGGQTRGERRLAAAHAAPSLLFALVRSGLDHFLSKSGTHVRVEIQKGLGI